MKSILFVLIALLGAASCSKDDKPEPKTQYLQGEWKSTLEVSYRIIGDHTKVQVDYQHPPNGSNYFWTFDGKALNRLEKTITYKDIISFENDLVFTSRTDTFYIVNTNYVDSIMIRCKSIDTAFDHREVYLVKIKQS